MIRPSALARPRSARARVFAIATSGALAALVLAGCSSPAPEPTSAADAPSSAAPVSGVETPAPSASPSGSATPPADPTCENIIPQATADDFRSLGWTSQEDQFRIGATALDDGIQCKWGDTKIASDRVQIFGWAPIDDDTAKTAQKDLVAAGWKVEKDADGTYVTENPDWLNGRGADGYGLTYFFGDGFVKLADTRQSLILVQGPR